MALTDKILNVEWLNQNSMRAYPLADAAGEADVSGAFVLPRDLLVDMVFPVDIGMNLKPAGFFVSNVTVFGVGLTVTFSYTDGVVTAKVGVLSVSAVGHTTNQSYYVAGVGDFAGMTGKVTVGSLETALKSGGSWDFDLTGGRLLATVFRPDIRGVKRVTVQNGTDVSAPLYDDVKLESGRNLRITVQDVGGVLSIRFDALASQGLNDECGCTNDAPLPPPIRTINGVPPKTDGSFNFASGNECTEFTTSGSSPGSIKLEDKCSKPCCGSAELDVVKNDLASLNRDARSMSRTQKELEENFEHLRDLKVVLQTSGVIGNADTEATT